MTRDGIWQDFNRRMIRAVNENPSDAAVRECEQQIAVAWHADMMSNERSERMAREQTAATLLAALLRNEGVIVSAPMRVTEQDAEFIAYAVALTDALRAALAKGTP
jgi:hypothetical protein